MAQRELFNAKTQQVEEAELSVDTNNEVVATFSDGGVLKFPAGLSTDEFDELIKLHEEHNSGQEVITPAMEAEATATRAASFALIGETEEVATPEEETETTEE